ncbi:Vitamin B12 import ATP-binding protein BtuD [subsurface metagenome]
MSIELRNVTKIFNKRGQGITALNDITLDIDEGELVGILGPNGAGKTTLTKILSTILLPTSGEVYLDNIPLKNDRKIRKIIGTVFGESSGRSLYYRLSVNDNLKFYATLAGVSKKETKARIISLLKYFDLFSKKDTLVMKLSAGMKTKVALIRALLPNPKILLLDEFSSGLDAVSSVKAHDLLIELNNEFGTTILLTSHNFTEHEELANRLLLIDKGCLVKDCSPEKFKQITAKKHIFVSFSVSNFHLPSFKYSIRESVGAELSLIEKRANLRGAFEARIEPKEFSLNESIARLTILIVHMKGQIYSIAPHSPSLKESFLAFLSMENERKQVEDSFPTPYLGDGYNN